MKINLTDLAKQTYEGKILKSTDFRSENDGELFDALGNKLDWAEFNPFGKVIQKVEIGWSEAREDVGLLFYFDFYDNPFFFYANEGIEVT